MGIIQDKGKTSVRRRLDDVIRGERRCCLVALGLSFCVFQTGYDSVVTAGFQGMRGFLTVFGYEDPNTPLGYNLPTTVQTLIQSLMTMGSLISAVFVFLIGSRVSRKTALWTGCLFSVVAVILQVVSTHLAALYVGRLLLGFSNGIFTPYTPIYITEMAPSFLLGSLLTISIFVSNAGGLVGVIVNNYTSKRADKLSYQIPMALVLITPLVVGILLFFLPDTPRYYIIKGDYEKAGNAIRRLRGITNERVIREEVEQMKSTYIAEQETGKVQFLDIFKGTDLRRTLILYGLACSQVITGRGFLAQFSVYFLGQSGVSDPFLWVMITYLLSLSANAVASFLLRYLPRRKILIWGLVIEAIAMVVMAIPSSVRAISVHADRVLIAMYIIHTWVGSATTTPAASCLMSELPSQKLRPEQVGTSSLIIWGTAWLVSYTTPYFINPEQLNWGPKYAYIWGACCTILAVWVLTWVPETKGRSLEQIDELFKKKVPSRKFSTFAVETENIDEKYSQRRRARDEDESSTQVVEAAVDIKG